MSKRVLIAPLDWGLGHTARCIPLIKELQLQGHEVLFAGTNAQYNFVTQHSIEIVYIPLFSYDVKYAKQLPQWIKIGSQLTKLKTKIKAEHKWLNDFLSKEKIDLVISDNRYGLYSKKTHSIFIGHQLSIQSPLLQNKINTIHASYINKFDECWIPDDDKINLSGALSINDNIKIPTKRIGILSRLEKVDKSTTKKFDVLVLLSGNEPQRSILEQKVMQELSTTKFKIALVRGTSSSSLNNYQNSKIFNLLNSEELKKLIESSETIICRSGYSSIMDLMNAHKKIILIPTPGQTEQEYLAKHLKNSFGFGYLKQNKLNTLVELINRRELKNINLAAAKTLAIKI